MLGAVQPDRAQACSGSAFRHVGQADASELEPVVAVDALVHQIDHPRVTLTDDQPSLEHASSIGRFVDLAGLEISEESVHGGKGGIQLCPRRIGTDDWL